LPATRAGADRPRHPGRHRAGSGRAGCGGSGGGLQPGRLRRLHRLLRLRAATERNRGVRTGPDDPGGDPAMSAPVRRLAARGLASAFGIQGIPAHRACMAGREVAEFTGPLPEPAVRDWLGRLRPSPADLAYQEGAALEEAGRLDEAAARYRHALAEAPAHAAAAGALNRVELAQRSAGLDRGDLERRAGDGDIDAVLALADLDARQGDFDAAFG